MKYGDFVWFDLITENAAKAADFYTGILDWELADAPDGTQSGYRMFTVSDEGVAGVAPDPPPEGAPSHWLGYIACEDADETARRCDEMGGSVHSERIDIPEVGAFYVMEGPAGGMFAAFTPTSLDEMPEIDPQTPGHVGWVELYTDDGESTFAFFSELFGWEKGQLMEVGSGKYQLFDNGGRDIGGIMDTSEMDEPPPSMWNYYFRVEDLDETAESFAKQGGAVIAGPMVVPGGDRIFVGTDPWGTMTSFTAPGE